MCIGWYTINYFYITAPKHFYLIFAIFRELYTNIYTNIYKLLNYLHVCIVQQ